MNIRHALPLCAVASLLVLSGCGQDSEQVKQIGSKQISESTDNKLSNSAADAPTASSNVQISEESALSAVVGSSEIPYPVYPNGSKYRVGGENGLKIVVFQTEDPFAMVDSYYKTITEGFHMPRLVAMGDYVRYSSGTEDKDPWATYRPGIVIHHFNDDGERLAVGAKNTAKTNIIMSF